MIDDGPGGREERRPTVKESKASAQKDNNGCS